MTQASAHSPAASRSRWPAMGLLTCDKPQPRHQCHTDTGRKEGTGHTLLLGCLGAAQKHHQSSSMLEGFPEAIRHAARGGKTLPRKNRPGLGRSGSAYDSIRFPFPGSLGRVDGDLSTWLQRADPVGWVSDEAANPTDTCYGFVVIGNGVAFTQVLALIPFTARTRKKYLVFLARLLTVRLLTLPDSAPAVTGVVVSPAVNAALVARWISNPVSLVDLSVQRRSTLRQVVVGTQFV